MKSKSEKAWSGRTNVLRGLGKSWNVEAGTGKVLVGKSRNQHNVTRSAINSLWTRPVALSIPSPQVRRSSIETASSVVTLEPTANHLFLRHRATETGRRRQRRLHRKGVAVQFVGLGSTFTTPKTNGPSNALGVPQPPPPPPMKPRIELRRSQRCSARWRDLVTQKMIKRITTRRATTDAPSSATVRASSVQPSGTRIT